MHRASSYALGFFLLTVISLHATAALSAVSDGNSTENGTVADGGFVPLVFSKVNQIIAREGNCALIDCNVTGDPDPSVQWFNSHGDLLDTETSKSSSLNHKECPDVALASQSAAVLHTFFSNQLELSG